MTNLPWLREFIVASASDITFLRQARDALLTHPKIRAGGLDANAAMCRALIVSAVTSVERTIEAWRGVSFLEKYNDKDRPNGEKIDLLQSCFEDAGVATDRKVLEDYLAIKYLRNTVAHVEWRNTDQQYVRQRDFPSDLRNFDYRHWTRVLATLWSILGYFSEAALMSDIPLDDDRLQEMTDLHIAAAHPQESRLLSLLLVSPDLRAVFWRNLESLHDWVRRGLISADGKSRPFDLARGWWRDYLDSTPFSDQSALAPIESSIETLEKLHASRIYPRGPIGVDLADLAKDPGDVLRAAQRTGLSSQQIEAIELALRTIRDANAPRMIWSDETPPDVAAQLLPLFTEVPQDLSPEDIVNALRLGSKAHLTLVNRVPLDLFLVELPERFPGSRSDCQEAGRLALGMFKLKTSWYAWVESDQKRPQMPPFNIWRHFDGLLDGLAAG